MAAACGSSQVLVVYKLTYTKRGEVEGPCMILSQASNLVIAQSLPNKSKEVRVRFTTGVPFTYPSPGHALGVLLMGERVARAFALQKRCQPLPAASSTYTIKHGTVALPRTRAATSTRKPPTACKHHQICHPAPDRQRSPSPMEVLVTASPCPKLRSKSWNTTMLLQTEK